MASIFPLNFGDISLLFAVTAITLLVASEMISPYYGAANLRIDRKRLKNAAMAMSTLFLATVAIRIATLISGL